MPPTDLLSFQAMPQAAAALRARAERIVELWNDAVKTQLPDADPLTTKQVRNSIPMVLEKIAQALESDQPNATTVLAEVGTAHGVARFQQNYRIEELITEYRLLRRIVFDQMSEASGGNLSAAETMAINMAIDLALQRGVTTFVEYLTEQLRSAAAAESKYLSFLSHDLRNHLNGVTLMLEVLGQRLGSEPQFQEDAQDVMRLQRSVSETIEGMNRLLQAERLRRHDVAVQLGPVDLAALADELLTQFARTTTKPIRLENAVPPDAAAHSNRELVTIVLQNLLGNAIKFSDRGTVRLEVRPHALGWLVAVSDEGPGIAPEQVATLFDAFRRGETHGQPGVGLGLNIASHAARMLGTELAVESTVGRGSTFSFTLPPADKGK